MKFSIFIGEKNLYILNGQVFVMNVSVVVYDFLSSLRRSWKATCFLIISLDFFSFTKE